MSNLYMHLTNYAIQKNSKTYVQNNQKDVENEPEDDTAHKRSLDSLYSTLNCMGFDVPTLKKEINDIVVKTLIVG